VVGGAELVQPTSVEGAAVTGNEVRSIHRRRMPGARTPPATCTAPARAAARAAPC